MADFKKYFILENHFEGVVFENDPDDEPTKYGIVLSDLDEYNLDVNQDGKIDWRDVRDLTADHASLVLKKLYWDFMKADSINNQSLAMYIVDSGLVNGRILIVKYVQSILGLIVDGIPGPKTINAINMLNDGKTLYEALKAKRIAKYNGIVAANPVKSKYYKGWINRASAIPYES